MVQGAAVMTGIVVIFIVVILSSSPVYGHSASCEDHTRQCSQWATQGYCQTSKQFMLLNCPVSCDACIDRECYDRDSQCNVRANRGHCVTQPNFMLSACPHSCDNCRLDAITRPPSTTPTITRPKFVCGMGHRRSGAPRRGTPSSGSDTAEGIINLRTSRGVIFPDDPRYEDPRISSRTRPQGNPQSSPQATPHATPQPGTISMIPGNGEMVTQLGVEEAFCGATPINDRFLITAAHCVFDPNNPVVTVRLGELDFSTDNEANSAPVDYQVSQIIVHPDFDPRSAERYNDIALIQTAKQMQFNEFVYPYCLSEDTPAPKTNVIGAGFGFVNATHRSSRLQEAELEVVDPAACEKSYRDVDLLNSLRRKYPVLLQGRDIMCASYPERSACSGDSGGPLFLVRDNKRYLVGVVGSGVSCRGNGASSLPGLYVRVADHIGFIDSVLYNV